MTNFKKELETHLQKFPTNPYLFIGSGLSRRYLNLPTWLDLLNDFSENLFLEKPFEYYQSKSNNDLPYLATILANEFHEKWWSLKEFEKSRKINKTLASIGLMLPFKIEISEYIKRKSLVNQIYNDEIALLRGSIIDGIITTNWDTFLNEIFVDFNIYIGQQELLFADTYSVGDIYKIHGCCTKPESVVVTDVDYEDFKKKNAYLAAKLLTVFVEHPIIFIGYSISDRNVTEILNSIVSCVDNINISKLKDRLIFVEWSPKKIDCEIHDGNIVLPNNFVLPIKHIKLNDFKELFSILAGLKKRLPIKVLKQFKDAVYDLVKANTPSKTLMVGDLSNLSEDDEVEFVVGVGIINSFSNQGYTAILAIDIIEDAILENKKWDSRNLVMKTIPQLLRGNTYLPIFRHLKKSNMLDQKGNILEPDSISVKYQTIVNSSKVESYYPAKNYLNKKSEIRRKYSDIKSISKDNDLNHTVLYIPFLEREKIDLSELKKFLKVCFKDETLKGATHFKKLVCLYDFLKYSGK